MHHTSRRLHEARLTDVVTRFLFLHYGANIGGHLSVVSAALHDRVEIVIEQREQARSDLAVGGDADAGTVSAEWFGYRSDDSDFAYAIVEGIATSCFAGDIRRQLP